jgi:hypothetical protein
MLVASGTAYSGEKEYTYKRCDKGKEDGVKISFKVSKSLGSVMKTIIRKDGKSSSTIDNCKIFDEDTFECETTTKAFVSRDYAAAGSSERLILSNGEWEQTNTIGMVRIGSKVIEETNYSYCGKEIKSIFNLFK